MKKKLFISCPMRGRTPEAILASREKMYKVAEALWGEELDAIASYVPTAVPSEAASCKHPAVACLGASIKAMANADYFIGVDSYSYTGCNIERSVAQAYDIPTHIIPTDTIIPQAEVQQQEFERWREAQLRGCQNAFPPVPLG